MLSRKDLQDAERLAKKAGIKYYVIKADAFAVKEFKFNDKRRCYFCKKNIMGGVRAKAAELGFTTIVDGKNADDGKHYRPGAQAADELINISGITASFVLFPDGEQVIISARSIGSCNVQVVLEKLGGGGNGATAGAQIKGKPLRQVLQDLVGAIDAFYA